MRPTSVERHARAADHRTASVAAANPERDFRHRWTDDDALGCFQEFLRDVVGDVEHLVHHHAAVFQATLFFIVVRHEER